MHRWRVTYEKAEGCCGGSEHAEVEIEAPSAAIAVHEVRLLHDFDIRRILDVRRIG